MELADSESRLEWENRVRALQDALGSATRQLKSYENIILRKDGEIRRLREQVILAAAQNYCTICGNVLNTYKEVK